MSPLLSWSDGGHPAADNSMRYQCFSRRGGKNPAWPTTTCAPCKTKGAADQRGDKWQAMPRPSDENPGVYRFVDAFCSSDPDSPYQMRGRLSPETLQLCAVAAKQQRPAAKCVKALLVVADRPRHWLGRSTVVTHRSVCGIVCALGRRAFRGFAGMIPRGHNNNRMMYGSDIPGRCTDRQRGQHDRHKDSHANIASAGK